MKGKSTMSEFDMIDQISKDYQFDNPLRDVSRQQVLDAAQWMALRIERNPLWKQYLAHINRPEKQINVQPWHALGERLQAGWMVLHAIYPENNITLTGLQRGSSGQNLIALAQIILSSTPYLWSDKMEKLADAAPLPKHVVSRGVMPHASMFWSRETAYVSELGDNNWICVFYTMSGIVIVGDLSQPNGAGMELTSGYVPLGRTWPTDYEGPGKDDVARVLKRCAFLNSPYIDQEQHRLVRHHRRQMERAGMDRKEIEDTIHVVKLRHRVVAGEHKQTPHEAAEWKHKWWVSGHYRAQWYPSEEAHRVIWIAPYLKGPEDAPLLEKIYSVER